MKQTASRMITLIAVVTLVTFVPSMALSQTADSTQALDVTTTTGIVASATANVMVVRTEQGVHHVFIFDRFTAKPQTISVGSTVRVLSRPSGEPGVRLATDVIPTTASPSAQQKESSEPVPQSVRQLESDIERQAKRYGLGFRTGAGLDPELLMLGVHAKMGSFFHRTVSFRPNAEYAWGEVTKLIALNLEGVFRLPFTPRLGRWSAYAGAGPSFVFSHRNFEENGEEGSIDFGDFNYDGGLNILAGMEFRSGLFFEVKTTVYAAPHLRLIVGYTF